MKTNSDIENMKIDYGLLAKRLLRIHNVERLRACKSDFNITFCGTNALYVQTPNITIAIDPYFSRLEGLLGARFITARIEPNTQSINTFCAQLPIPQCIIVTHSHFDHILDVPVVAKTTGAHVFGTLSTKNFCLGAGMEDAQISEIKFGDSVDFGSTELTFCESAHSPLPAPVEMIFAKSAPEICTPVKPPYRPHELPVGKSIALLIKHETSSLAVICGGIPDNENIFPVEHIDCIIVPLGGLIWVKRSYRRQFFEKCVARYSPSIVLASHWDNFTLPHTRNVVPMRGSAIAAAHFAKMCTEISAQYAVLPFLSPLNVKIDSSTIS